MRDCEHCEKYKKSDSGFYMCSSWNCIHEEDFNPLYEKYKCMADIPNDENYWGIEYKTQCNCGGEMISMRVRPNGHMRASCMKCGWKWIE